MKHTLLAAALLLAPFVRAEDEELCNTGQYETVQCGNDTVVVFGETQSPDKHYALGWTIQPITQNAKPVDWTKLNVVKIGGHRALFSEVIEDIMTGKDPAHRIINGVIDLRSKSFKPLPIVGTTPLDPIDSMIDTKWVDEQHAIILRNGKWSTDDVLFIRLASEPLVATDILPQMNDQVSKLFHEKRPLAPGMHIRYEFTEIGGRIPCKIKDGILHALFVVQIPRSTDGEDIDGHILISLKDGTPLKAVSDAPDDKPFVGELGEADKQLNQVYGKLRKSLVGDARKQLVTDQLKWISTRNVQARQLAKEVTSHEAIAVEEYREARNQQALKLTRERTEVLQKQLATTSSK